MSTQGIASFPLELVEAGSNQINKERQRIHWWMTFISSQMQQFSFVFRDAFPCADRYTVWKSGEFAWGIVVRHSGGGYPYIAAVKFFQGTYALMEFSLDPSYCNGPSFVKLEHSDVGVVAEHLQQFVDEMSKKIPLMLGEFEIFIQAAKRAGFQT